MRNVNVNEPQNKQSCQTSVMVSADLFKFCNNVDFKKDRCKNQCHLCKRLELEYNFKNKKNDE